MSEDPVKTLAIEKRSTVAGLATAVQEGVVNLIMSVPPTPASVPTAIALFLSIASTE
jgi:hypothetical protein